MRLKLKLLITATFGLLLLGVALAPAQPAYAALFDNAKDQACNGINVDAHTSGCSTANGSGRLSTTLKTALSLFSIVVGVIALLMIIIGGVKFVTSQGESAAVASAKNTIIYALVGLVIVAFSQFIVRFVLAKTK